MRATELPDSPVLARAHRRRPPFVHEWVAATAADRPDAVALAMGAESVSYAVLVRQACRIAHALRSAGVAPGALVAIRCERRQAWPAALLGVLYAGNAFVPVSPEWPAARAARLLALCEPACAIVDDPAAAVAGGCPEGLPMLALHDIAERPTDAATATAPPETAWDPDGLCYVYGTSGSTGEPKGIAGRLKGIDHFVRWEIESLGLGPDVRVSQWTTPAFDAYLRDLFVPLCAGGTVCLLPDDCTLGEGARLRRWLAREQVTVLHCVPSVLRLVMPAEGAAALGSLCYALVAGEVLQPADVARWYATPGRCPTLINLYGPSETTMTKFVHRVSPADRQRRTVPIGQPMPGAAAIVVDASGRPCPPETVGEIYIRTPYRTLGYYNQPSATAAAFVRNPFSADPEDVVYKTGDLGRQRRDGTFEYLGRRDGLVKLRGVRVELGEIEAALLTCPGVAQAAAAVHGTQLVAYVSGRTTDAIVRGHLQAQLPAALLPNAIVVMPALPLMVTGKVDRRALPPPSTVAAAAAPADRPRTPVEEILAASWAELLAAPAVGIHDHFFALGGHSLLAMQLVARVRAAFQVDVPLKRFLDAPTVAGLAEAVERARADGRPVAPPVVPVARDRPLPASYAQRRLWFLEQLDAGTALYSAPVAVRLRGALDVAALQRSLTAIVRRHEVLRTTFEERDGEVYQRIHEPQPLPLSVIDLREADATRRDAAATAIVARDAAVPFDLRRGPLLRARLLRLDSDSHVLSVTMHHVVTDAWSSRVVTTELAALYDAATRGVPDPLPALAVQYADYAIWQRNWLESGTLARQLAFWRQTLSDLPALELPTDFARPPRPSFAGGLLACDLPADVVQPLRALGQQAHATLFMVLAAALDVTLARWSNQSDIVIGTDIGNRGAVETESLIGFFVNQIVLRTTIGAAASFREVVAAVRETTLSAYDHQDVPFDRVVDALQPQRDLSRSPLFQVVFLLKNAPSGTLVLRGVEIEGVDVDRRFARHDLTVVAREHAHGVHIVFEYRADLFEAATMTRLLAHFERVVRQVSHDPDAAVDAIDLLTPAERTEVVERWNATAAPVPDTSVGERIAAQAARRPDAMAVSAEDGQITYGVLEAIADRLAARLRAHGVGPEVNVGVCLPRGLALLPSILAIWKTGGVYVPLEPDAPVARITTQIDDLGNPLVLATRAVRARWGSAGPARVLCVDDADVQATIADATDTPPPLPLPAARIGKTHLAYVIYTSGSTGQPKGAMNSSLGLANRIAWMQSAFGLTCDDRVLHKTPIGFDVSVWELVWPGWIGACLVMARPDGHRDPSYLASAIQREQITVAHFVPSLLEPFVREADSARCRSLRQIVCSGEALWPAVSEACAARLPLAALDNLYGPTEAAIDVTWWRWQSGAARVPLGRPVANTQVYVRDGSGRPTPVGVPGEIWLGGVQVGRGYWRRPRLTAERFMPDPFGHAPGARLYRTGDRGRWRPDGTLEYLGRLDFQVKLRGQRIELGEVEARLLALPGVRQAVAIVREQRLLAYVTGRVEPAALRAALQAQVPDALVPAAMVVLPSLPLTANGKIDRAALPDPPRDAHDAGTTLLPRDGLETLLQRLWEETLGRANVDVRDSFFDLGGHSLNALALCARIGQAAGIKVPVRILFEMASVAEMAAHLRQQSGARLVSPVIPMQTSGTGTPLFCIHPSGGTVHWYVPMARRLGGSRIVYGIQSCGLDDGREPLRTIEEMASEYLRHVRAVQPEGPYRLLGWSMGALIAYEMARQLDAMGERAGFLVLLDGWPDVEPRPLSPATWAADVEELAAEIVANLVRRDLGLMPPAAADDGRALYLEHAKRRLIVPEDVEAAEFARFLRVYGANILAQRAYRPQPFAGRLVLVRSRGASHAEADGAGRWQALAAGGVEVHECPASHLEFLQEPNLTRLVAMIDPWLAAGTGARERDGDRHD